MEANKKTFVNFFLSLVGIVAFSLAVISRNIHDYQDVRGDYIPYSIVFGTSKNKIGLEPYSPSMTHSGNGFVATELDNFVAFEYNALYHPTDIWQTIQDGGSSTNTQPITEMTGITLTKHSSSANLKIYWSSVQVFSEERAISFDETSPLTISTNFGGFLPN